MTDIDFRLMEKERGELFEAMFDLLIIKRVWRVLAWWPARLRNSRLMPKGYRVFRGLLSSSEVAQLKERYSPMGADGRLPSGGHEERCYFLDVRDFVDLAVREDVKSLIQAYEQAEAEPEFVMHNRLLCVSELGSGSGWHRDSFAPAIKVFVPLTPCNSENGATRFAPHTLRTASFLADAVTGLRSRAQETGFETLSIVPGDVVIADVSARHAGGGINVPGREMLTLYFKDAR